MFSWENHNHPLGDYSVLMYWELCAFKQTFSLYAESHGAKLGSALQTSQMSYIAEPISPIKLVNMNSLNTFWMLLNEDVPHMGLIL